MAITVPVVKRVIGLVDAIVTAGYPFWWQDGIPMTDPAVETAVQAIIDAYDNLPAYKRERSKAIQAEGLMRVQALFPALSDFDALDLEAERWKSIKGTATAPTVKYQKLINIYTAARNAQAQVAAAATTADVDAVVVAWPA